MLIIYREWCSCESTNMWDSQSTNMWDSHDEGISDVSVIIIIKYNYNINYNII
jgi:hypothetical protein